MHILLDICNVCLVLWVWMHSRCRMGQECPDPASNELCAIRDITILSRAALAPSSLFVTKCAGPILAHSKCLTESSGPKQTSAWCLVSKPKACWFCAHTCQARRTAGICRLVGELLAVSSRKLSTDRSNLGSCMVRCIGMVCIVLGSCCRRGAVLPATWLCHRWLC